jgi:hypothetical protein
MRTQDPTGPPAPQDDGDPFRAAGRARSIFGAARPADLGGDSAAAAAGYREYLRIMEKGDGRRPELAVARTMGRKPGSR